MSFAKLSREDMQLFLPSTMYSFALIVIFILWL